MRPVQRISSDEYSVRNLRRAAWVLYILEREKLLQGGRKLSKLFRYFYKLSVTTQIFFIVFCLILPINIISLGFAALTQSAYLQQSKDSAWHTGRLYMNTLDERINSADVFFAGEVDKNPKLLKLRDHKEGNDYAADATMYWQDLSNRVKSFMEADAYFFYLNNENYADVAVKTDLSECRTPLKTYIRENAVEKQQRRWFVDEVDGEKWLIHIFNVHDFYYGAMIHLGLLEDEIAENLSVEKCRVSIDSQPALAPEEGFVSVDVSGERSEAAVHIWMDRKEIMGKLPMVQQIGMIMVVIYILCIPVLLLIIRRIFIRPMNALDHAMDELETGNPDYRMPESAGNRETSALNRKYNSMADNLKNLRIQVYEKELEKRDIEATNLRLQVNPHFILNCLNIIFSMAKSEKLPEIKQFTKYLSGYLRFSLWHTHGAVCLKEELHCVENYLQIQKMRFPGAFTYIENVEEGLDHVRLPSLLILNFIENTIKYALTLGNEIEIIVIARKEENFLVLSICDTGCGMDADTLAVLRSGEILNNESGKHIGIWNCRRRLALKYGEKAYMNITSSPGGGTQVFIRLPLEEDDKNESVNCG